MNKKQAPYILIILLGILLFAVNRFIAGNKKAPKSSTSQKKNDPASTVNRNHDFDRRVSYIEYTEHAKCRMECRKISKAEVEEIMKEGEINYRKTDVKAKPCPAYALEGVTQDSQHVRIVFGQCDSKTKVITCIDLNTDWECHCGSTGSPQDDNKYKNRN